MERHPLIGELAVGEHVDFTRAVALVGHFESPVLEGLSQGDEVRGLGRNAFVARLEDGIGCAVAAGGLVLVEWLAHRLPRGRPVIAIGLVPQVEVAPRLIHRDAVEEQAQEAPARARFVEAIATRVVGDDGAILGGA